ncbi:ubiquinol-cytochrome c reductase cytochrome c subunit [Motilibacter peucedani]|uniref:Cytochrome bc1 complex cytochrome c subunit n=2 Tax=Motilibacter peucedani TaxID=598650 RepID=A0A420XPC2_9ACTN|nr:c-type cytochrome [Motilibacter peucedani]RKS74043.1 ubiquinol-cytochrome c reductase cytochrome c subunit [Motilibacter peucedani]
MTSLSAPAPRTPLRRRPVGTFLLLLVALSLMAGAYAVFAPSTRAATEGVGSADRGRQLFQQNCSTCHGLSAEGSGNGPSLVGVGAASVDFQVGTGRMPLAAPGAQAARGRVLFSQDEINDLAAYVASLGPGPSIPSAADVDPSKANSALGGEIFRTNCSMCHNFAGAGGALTQGKYAPSLLDTSPKHVAEAMLTGPQNMPVFSDAQISPAQKRAIIAYLKASKDTSSPGLTGLGALGPTSEGLFGWIAGLGLLIACAVWLAQKAR